jgi:hypothetical protein
LLLAVAVAGGCPKGSEPPPAPPPVGPQPPAPPEPPPPEPPPPEPPPVEPGPPAPPAPAFDPAEFQKRLQQVLALERETKFSRALLEARQVRQDFASHPDVRQVDEIIYRLKESSRIAQGLPFAVQSLGSEDQASVRVAKQKLRDAGEVGRLFLRVALREETPAVARGAAETLADLRDEEAPPLLLKRLAREPRSPLTIAIMDGLKRMVQKVQPPELAEALRLARDDDALDRRELVGMLIACFEKTCGGQAETFATRTGDPGAVGFIRDYVRRALASPDDEAVAWACEDGGPWRGHLNGLHGRYYRGQGLVQRVGDRFDTALAWHDNRTIPVPGGRQDDFSARWDGFLQVVQPGDYTFFLLADDRADLTVNDQKVTQVQWDEAAGTVRLAPGLHPIAITFYQTDGDCRLRVHGQGPGLERTAALPYRCRPWKEPVLAARAAVDRLADEKWEAVRDADQTLLEAGDVGRMLLDHAVLEKGDPVAARAAEMLLEWDDGPAVPFLLARLRKDPTMALAVAATAALRGLARHLGPEDLARLNEEVKADPAGRVPPAAAALCGVLEGPCGGDRQKLDALLKDEGAAARLEEHVRRALASDDAAAVARAAQFGQPFAPSMPGLRARYYVGDRFERLVLEQQEELVHADSRRFPYPDGRQDFISARWDGLLDIRKAGQYGFYLMAEDAGRLAVAGRTVVETTGGQDRGGTVTLAAGLHPIRVEFRQYRQGAGSRIHLDWSKPGGGREPLTADLLRTPPWAGHCRRLGRAVTDLTADKARPVAEARAALKAAGGTGLVYLSNAVRYEAEPVVAEAVRLLVESGDASGAAAMIERLRRDAAGATAPALARGLSALAPQVGEAEFPWLLQKMRADQARRMTPHAAALCAALETRCGRDAAKFNTLVKDDAGYEALRAYVSSALESSDAATVARAAEFGGPFAPYLRGVRGRYYEGQDLDRLTLDRLDRAVRQERGRFPHPQNRQQGVSAVWTGFIEIAAPGDYTFFVQGHDAGAVWVGGKKIAESRRGEDRSGTIALAAGLHPIRVEFHQDRGDCCLNFAWQGPGFGRSEVPATLLHTPPWEAGLVPLHEAVRKLGSSRTSETIAAKDAFRAMDPAGRAFLRHAVRHGSDGKAVAEAAAMLAWRRDALAAPLLAARLRQDPGPPLATALVEGLGALAAYVGAEDAAWLHRLPAGSVKGLDGPGRDALLLAVLERACGSDKDKLSALVGDPNAYDALKARVEAALADKDAGRVAWACQHGGPWAPTVPGLRGQYFDGRHFGRCLGERLDQNISIHEGRYNLPGNRSEHVTVCWTGRLLAGKAGAYTFYVRADDGAALWVDGRPVVDAWTNLAALEATGTVDLAAGDHALEVIHWQGDGRGDMRVEWSGPGFGRTDLRTETTRTPLWEGELKALAEAVRKLAHKDGDERNRARDLLRRAGGVGLVYLRGAVRHQPPAIAEAAADLLKELKDAEGLRLWEERTKPAPAPQ